MTPAQHKFIDELEEVNRSLALWAYRLLVGGCTIEHVRDRLRRAVAIAEEQR